MLSKEKLKKVFEYECDSDLCWKYTKTGDNYVIGIGEATNPWITLFICLLEEGIRVQMIQGSPEDKKYVDSSDIIDIPFYNDRFIPYSELYYKIGVYSQIKDTKVNLTYYWKLARMCDTSPYFSLKLRELTKAERIGIVVEAEVDYYNAKFDYSIEDHGRNGYHFTLMEEETTNYEKAVKEYSKIEEIERRLTTIENKLNFAINMIPSTEGISCLLVQ